LGHFLSGQLPSFGLKRHLAVAHLRMVAPTILASRV